MEANELPRVVEDKTAGTDLFYIRVYIYASLKPGEAEEFERMHIQPGELPTGVLVGTVEIADCTGEPGATSGI